MKFEGISWWRFAKYFLTSLVTLGLNLTIIWILKNFLGLAYLLAVAIGFGCETTVLYVLNRTWTFRGVVKTTAQGGYARAWIVAISTLSLILILEWIFVQEFAIQYLVARLLVAPFAYAWSFLWDGTFTFKAFTYYAQNEKITADR